MPQIAHFQVEKLKSSPHPPPARSLRSLGLGRFAPSQRLRPPNVLAHYAIPICWVSIPGGWGDISPPNILGGGMACIIIPPPPNISRLNVILYRQNI